MFDSSITRVTCHLAFRWSRGNTHSTVTSSVTLYYEQNGIGPRYSWKEIRFEQHVCSGMCSESALKLPTDITHRFE